MDYGHTHTTNTHTLPAGLTCANTLAWHLFANFQGFTTILYTVQLYTCTKAYLQSSLLFPFKWENVPIIPA